jgi:hypothetical protein
VLFSIKETITGVILPLLDMGTDIATAGTHFYWGDYGLVIIFV